MPPHQRTCANGLDQPAHIHEAQLELFHANAFSSPYIPRNYEPPIIQSTSPILAFHMEIFHIECCSCSTAVLDGRSQTTCPSNVIAHIYAAFFSSDFTQQMQNLPEETLFSCFVTALIMLLKLSLHGKMNVMRVGVKASISHPSHQSTESLPCLNHGGIIL